MAEKEDNKVMDVAKPGSSKPDTGSKPMVVGHKIMKDPTLKEADDVSDEKTEETSKPQLAGTKTINPINHDEEKETELETKTESEPETEKIPETVEKKEIKPLEKDESVPEDKEQAEEVPEQTKEEKDKSAQDLSLEQEENLQKIIKEKTYNVHVQEASFSSLKTFLKTLIIILLIGLVVIVVLTDAEIIDLGLKLPFDFL